MTPDEFRDFILTNIPNSKVVSGGSHILTRCPFCGDSKDMNKAHFYINIGIDGTPPMYKCHKGVCARAGLFTSDTLRAFHVFDGYMASCLDASAKTSKVRRQTVGTTIYNINNGVNYMALPDTRYKLDYISNRLGFDFKIQEVYKRKICLNLLALLNHNDITEYKRHINIMEEISTFGIGFINMDNASINFRNVKPEKTFIDKHILYKIYDIDNPLINRVYVIPTTIDVTRPIQIHIAEGGFDILSVFYNLCDANTDNRLYIGMRSASYYDVFHSLIATYGFTNIDTHFYVDNNIRDYKLKELVEFSKCITPSISIHRNVFEGEEDFGVPLNRIKDRKEIW